MRKILNVSILLVPSDRLTNEKPFVQLAALRTKEIFRVTRVQLTTLLKSYII